jgi:hypothetical protein
LPGDFQLTKHTIYAIIGDGKQKPVLEVFNATSYDVIGTQTVNGAILGSHWTILRFLLLDLWLMKLVRASKKVKDESVGLDRIDNIIGGIAHSAENLLTVMVGLDPLRIFPTDGYVGVNIDEGVVRKKYRPKANMWIPSKQ